MDYQARYVAYCKAHGRAPCDQMAHDEAAYPGGKMCGFILWTQAQWSAWKRVHGYDVQRFVVDPEAHRAFDRWLVEQVEK